MAFVNMRQELLGEISGLNFALAGTKINEALTLVYNEQRWSFQFVEGGWFTPGLVGGTGFVGGSTVQSPGTITVTPYSNQITGDATASAAWTGLTGLPFLTQYQIRSPYYSLYNIIAVDSTIPTAVVLTIDRAWMEPAQTNGAYMMYQAYFPTPATFKNFLSAVDTTNNNPMDYWSFTRSDLDVVDPQRVNFDQPAYFVPYQVDQRPNSATLGQMLFELWPHPLNQLPYTWRANIVGPPLVNPTDTLPYPLTEECVKWRAREVLYLWKEAQKGDNLARGAGANWQFLAQEAHAQYMLTLKEIKRTDEGLVSPYWSKFRRDLVSSGEPFATINGQLNVGRW